MVSKRARRIYTTETISGFVRSGPPWSIIGLHPDNVEHDASVWSQVLPSPILFKEVTTTSTMHLKVTGKKISLVRSRILPSPILFKEVTSTRNPCSLEQNLPLSEGSRPCFGRSPFVPSWSGGIRMFHCISTSRNTIVLKRRGSGPTVLDYSRKGMLKKYLTSQATSTISH